MTAPSTRTRVLEVRGGCGCGCRSGWESVPAEASYRGKGPAQQTDDQIKLAVEERLTEDPWLDASGVQVSVQQGIVTLTGAVSSRAAKRRAEGLTDTIWGVRDVQNSLSITETPETDPKKNASPS